MAEIASKIRNGRFGLLYWILVVFLLTAFISRTVLLGYSAHEVDLGILSLLKVYLLGLFFDLVAFSYFMIPVVLILTFLPDRFLKKGVLYIIFFLVFFYYPF